MRTRPSSSRAHSWSFEYRNPSGTSTGRQIIDQASGPDQAADPAPGLRGATAGLAARSGLRPHVRDRQLRVREGQQPAVLGPLLDAVDEEELPGGLLTE